MGIKIPGINTKNDIRQVFIFAALILALGGILYFNFFLKPQVLWVYNTLVKSGKISADFKEAGTDISRIDIFRKEIDVNKGKIEKYEKMLPVEQEIPGILEELSTMARNSGIKIVGITPVVENKVERRNQVYQEIPIVISAKCGYHELGSFLANIENSSRFMKVADIEIKANKASPRKHDVELILVSYMLLNK